MVNFNKKWEIMLLGFFIVVLVIAVLSWYFRELIGIIKSVEEPQYYYIYTDIGRLIANVLAVFIVYYVLRRILILSITRAGGSKADIKMLLGFIKPIFILIATLLVINQFYPIESLLVATGAFSGLFLGWSLQQPVTGFAAWVFISIKRPFKIGDRIFLPSLNIIGDVIDVGVFHTVLNQVGGTVGSEEASGRIVLIPNAIFFSTTIINYTRSEEKPYILDEVVVRLTFDSNLKEAERILINAAKEVTKDIIEKTGLNPYVRAELWNYGVLMRLRYNTLAKDRVRISHEITRRIVEEFQKNDKVDFAIPYTYSYRAGLKIKKLK